MPTSFESLYDETRPLAMLEPSEPPTPPRTWHVALWVLALVVIPVAIVVAV